MSDIKHAPVCGYYCGDCHFLGETCSGCGYVSGRPFWTVEMPGGICPIYECCVNLKQLEHCGVCPDLPCRIIHELRDPDMNDSQFQESIDQRLKNLSRRVETGTEAWLEEMVSNDE